MVKDAADVSHVQQYKRRNRGEANDCPISRITGNLPYQDFTFQITTLSRSWDVEKYLRVVQWAQRKGRPPTGAGGRDE